LCGFGFPIRSRYGRQLIDPGVAKAENMNLMALDEPLGGIVPEEGAGEVSRTLLFD